MSELQVHPRVEVNSYMEDTDKPAVWLSANEETITQLAERLKNVARKESQEKGQALKYIEELPELIKALDFLAIETILSDLQATIKYLKEAQALLDKDLHTIRVRLAQELNTRPDLIFNDDLSNLTALDVLDILEQIFKYDNQKKEVLAQIETVQTNLVTLQTEIETWLADEGTKTTENEFVVEEEVDRLTLAEIQELFSKANVELSRIQNRLLQLRRACISRIQTLIQTIQEYGGEKNEKIFNQLTVEQLQAQQLEKFTSRQLYSLEETLDQRLKGLPTPITPSAEITQKLKHEWSTDQFFKLLKQLATEKRDVETLLLLISGTSAHYHNSRIELTTEIISSLLHALEKLSRKSSPFKLLNLLSLDILSVSEISDPIGRTMLCLALIGASTDSEFKLPEGILWQLNVTDLPFPTMRNWNQLWQAVLAEEALPEIMDDELVKKSQSMLATARTNLEQMLAFENGGYVRLHSLQSKRHKALLGNILLPDLQNQLSNVEKLEEQVTRYPQTLQSSLEKLKEEVDRLTVTLAENEVKKRYENGLHQNDIDETSPFLRRTALRIILETADSILEFVNCLKEDWLQKAKYEKGLTQHDLLTELDKYPELQAIGRLVFDYLRQSTRMLPLERSNQLVNQATSDIIIRELLGNATYVIQLPHLIGYLVNNPFEWSSLYEVIIADLSGIHRNIDTAHFLLQQEAPNQIQLLASHLPLEVQKRAQELKSKKEKEALAIQTKLLQVMDTPLTFERDQSLGRWGLIKKELTKALAEYETLHVEKQKAKQDVARKLRHEVFSMREAIYDNERVIPTTAKEDMLAGLEEVQRVASDFALLELRHETLRAFLDEIQYRLDNKAWDVEKVRNGLEFLRNNLAEPSTLQGKTLTAKEILKFLDQGNLQQLGLNQDIIPASTVETRWHILHNWLELSDLPSFHSDKLNFSQRGSISSLFQYFARMTKLQQVREKRSKDGQHLAYEEPVVYSYWELLHPKTDALRKDCILIALPGDPPNPLHLRQLEDFIEENQWLDDYTMVLLFAPGCHPMCKKRLGVYKSLVIIDEQALLKMVLAETKQRTPIGYLRSMMLNALGAENVDIFKVNQLVNSRTSIFVGRDYLIKRIAGSDGNYALYGGRRIGKSSVLMEIGNLLEQRNTTVVFQSFEGEGDYSDNAIAALLMRKLKLGFEANSIKEFKEKLQEYLDEDENRRIIFLFDEVDKYIEQNPNRHILIEALRALSDKNGSRLRVVVAGFMALHNCLEGEGPYTPTSDPWRRMFNNDGPLPNLQPASAENIIQEGFIEILGWQFERRSIPQLIVKQTGGHPAFVQKFCDILQKRVAVRGDRCIQVSDIDAVFNDSHSESFIAFVRDTLRMNLESIERYIILYLAQEYKNIDGFTRYQAIEITKLCNASIPPEELDRSLQRLEITSVVQKRSVDVYEFSIPDYPFILSRLGETKHLNDLEMEIEKKYPV